MGARCTLGRRAVDATKCLTIRRAVYARTVDEPEHRPEAVGRSRPDDVEAADRSLEIGRQHRCVVERPDVGAQLLAEETDLAQIDAISSCGEHVIDLQGLRPTVLAAQTQKNAAIANFDRFRLTAGDERHFADNAIGHIPAAGGPLRRVDDAQAHIVGQLPEQLRRVAIKKLRQPGPIPVVGARSRSINGRSRVLRL